MNKKNITITVIAIIIMGIGSFYGGTLYQKKATAAQRSSMRGNAGQQLAGGNNNQSRGQRFNQGQGGAFENGEIISKDENSITIKNRDGSSKIIYFSDSTTIGKSVDGSVSDLAIGQQVMVNGQTDSSGMITAQNIQIRPSAPTE
jgi:hypothetical protein